jgi:septal ring factor EnvC (AmiA/AmiB activator)
MSSRVSKSKSKSKSSLRSNDLLSAILSHSVNMPSCSACSSRGIPSCEVSPIDSSRCSECVRLKRSRCDVLGVTPAQLRKIADQHAKLESELEAMEEKVLRLRKQKKMWFEKMMRAVSRGIDSVEELERVEREEAEREERRLAENRPPSSGSLDADFGRVWDDVYPDVALSPSLLADLGFANPGASGGTASTGAGTSSGAS